MNLCGYKNVLAVKSIKRFVDLTVTLNVKQRMGKPIIILMSTYNIYSRGIKKYILLRMMEMNAAEV